MIHYPSSRSVVDSVFRPALTLGFCLVLIHGAFAVSSVSAQIFYAQANGIWSDAATWTPAGGPPGAGRTAVIGAGNFSGAAPVVTVSLTANQNVSFTTLGIGGSHAHGTLDLGAFQLTTNSLSIGSGGGKGTILRNGGSIIANELTILNNNTFTYSGSDQTGALSISGAGVTVNTSAVGNITTRVTVSGSTLNLGANLQLSEDLQVTGSGLNANGHNISARDIWVGSGIQPGTINNRGTITATRNLTVSGNGNTFSLEASDSVANEVRTNTNGVLNLHANTAAQSATINGGGVINTAATSNLSNFVAMSGTGSRLNLGDHLVLSGDLTIMGSGINAGTVDANGHNITARDILIGSGDNAGEIINRGTITATRNLNVSRVTFSLNASDTVVDTVSAQTNGVLNLHANTAAQSVVVNPGGTVNTVVTSNLSTSARVAGNNSRLNLGANLVLSNDLEIFGSGALVATVNANGHNITARDIFVGQSGSAGEIINRGTITATRNLSVSNSSFSLGAFDSVAQTVGASNNGVLNLHANTVAQSATVTSGGTVNTAASGNLNTMVQLVGAGSQLNLGANLVLSGDLEVGGNQANVATVDAGGHNVTARYIYFGRGSGAGQFINDGRVVAERFLFERGSFMLTGGDDVATDLISITGQSSLTVQQSLDQLTGLTLNGSGLTISAGSSMILNFDTQPIAALDWGFRWINPVAGGDRVSDLTNLLNMGRIVINSSETVSIFDRGDGYTYIGYNAIPEPGAAGLLAAWAVLAISWRRRTGQTS